MLDDFSRLHNFFQDCRKKIQLIITSERLPPRFRIASPCSTLTCKKKVKGMLQNTSLSLKSFK